MKLNSMENLPRVGSRFFVSYNNKLFVAWCEKIWRRKRVYVPKTHTVYSPSRFTGWTAHPDSDKLAMKAIEGRE